MASKSPSADDGALAQTFKVGEPITQNLIAMLHNAKKNEKSLKDISRAFSKVIRERNAIEAVLKAETPIERISESDALSDYFKNLQLKIKIGNEEIVRLNNQIKELNSAASESQNQAAKISELEQQISTLNDKISVLQNSLSSSTEQLSQSQQKLEAALLENNDFKSKATESESLSSINKQQTETILALESSKSSLEGKIAALSSEKDSLEQQVKERSLQIETLTEEKDSLFKSTQDISSLSAKLESQISFADFNIESQSSDAKNGLKAIYSLLEPIFVVPKNVTEETTPKPPSTPVQSAASVSEPEQERVMKIVEDYISKSKQTPKPSGKKNKGKNKNNNDGNSASDKKAKSSQANLMVSQLKSVFAANSEDLINLSDSSKQEPKTTEPCQHGAVIDDLNKKLSELKLENTNLSEKILSSNTSQGLNSLTETLQGKEKHITDLTNKIAQLEGEVLKLNELAKEKQADNEKIKASKEDISAQLSKLKDELLEKTTELNDIESGNSALKSELTALQSEKERLEGQLKQLTISNKENLKTIEELKDQISKTKGELSLLQKTNEALEEKVATSTKEIESLSEKVSGFDKTFSLIQSENTELKEKMCKFDGNEESYKKEKLKLESEIGELKASLKKMEAEKALIESGLQVFKTENEKVMKRSQSLAAASKDAITKKVEIEKLLSASKRGEESSLRLAEAESKLASSNTQINTLNEKLAKVESEAVQKEREASDATQYLKSKEEAILDLEKKLIAVQQDLAQSRALFTEKTMANSKLQARINDIQFNYEKLQSQIENEKQSHKFALSAAEQDLIEMQTRYKEEISVLQNKVGDLEEKAKTFKEAANATKSEKIELEETKKKLQMYIDEIAMLKSVTSSLNEKISELNSANMEIGSIKKQNADIKMQIVAKNEEARNAANRWKQIHRDMKDEIRKLQRQLAAAGAGGQQDGVPGGGVGSPVSGYLKSPVMESRTEFPNSRSTSFTHSANQRAAALRANISVNGPISGNGVSKSGKLFMENSGDRKAATTQNTPIGAGFLSSPKATHGGEGATFSGKPKDAGFSVKSMNGGEYFGTIVTNSHGNGGGSLDKGIHAQSASPSLHEGNRESTEMRSATSEYDSAKNLLNDPEYINVDYLRHVLFRFINDKERRVGFIK
ncbi:hypothetical protein BB560_004180 [Smittium megazygosporum]|uniref:Uncharacterized protein n=1 Tax=Smittium megazygosporum TaxID=133381 RepID=A0A2T9Z9Z1_9FUNG|nr:hypothetical protein BB560_004180 [Smittium megazygosporum]